MPRIMETHQLSSSFQPILMIAGKFSIARSMLGTCLKTFLLLLLTLVLPDLGLHYKKLNVDGVPAATGIIFSIVPSSFAGNKSKWHHTLSNVGKQLSASSDSNGQRVRDQLWQCFCKGNHHSQLEKLSFIITLSSLQLRLVGYKKNN